MKKTTLAIAVTMALGGLSFNTQAALTTGSLLAYTNGNVGNFDNAAAAGPSWFSMQLGPTSIAYTGLQVGLDGGVKIGISQPLPTGVHSHSGNPYGGSYTSDIGAIDTGWSFLGNTGLHFTTTPINVVTDNGTTKTLDFSGWRMSWNGISSMNWGGGTQVVTGSAGSTTYNNGTGLATITCSTSSCSNGSTFTLDYTAIMAHNDPSDFGGVPYALHLTGHVNAVPVPASAWLLGSGLAGLAGAARRRRRDRK
ncbi:MAG: VPLPA-CTERM sorting domain-containing protein [Gammaproteobacteria bacterium]